MSGLIVRNAVAGDVGHLIRITRECGLEHWSPEAYLQEIASAQGFVAIVAPPGGSPAGFIAARVVPGSVDGTLDAEIFNIAVLPSFRGQGTAGRLLDSFRYFCRSLNVRHIWLEVRESNAPAIAFYIKHQFEKAGLRRGFYARPAEDAVLMRLELNTQLSA